MTRTLLGSALVWALCSTSTPALAAGGAASHARVPEAKRRAFVVEVRGAEGWQRVGRSLQNRFNVARTVTIPRSSLPGGAATLRLRAEHGGAGHLDAVTLGGAAPKAVRGAEAKKLARADLDVSDATETVELDFDVPAGTGPVELVITGRIERKVISKTPFRFPSSNRHHPIGPRSTFYRYALGSRRGTFTVDGDLEGESLGKPLFREQQPCISGHPQGAVYGWVKNDDRHLYVAIDFTPDNTMDGNADYATVFVRRDGVVTPYKVTMKEQRWGKPGFGYTSRVSYQHKTYELAIPLEAVRSKGAKTVELAFATYGTASAGSNDAQPMSYDPSSDTFAYLYWDQPSADFELRAQRYAGDLTPTGTPLMLGATSGSQPFAGIAADTVNGAFLVAWQDFDNDRIVARRMLANGTLEAAFDVYAGMTGDSVRPARVAFDDVNQRYLVVWVDRRTGGNILYGRLVSATGVPQGAGSITLYDATEVGPYSVAVAFNATDAQYLVTFNDTGGGAQRALRLDVMGAPMDNPIALFPSGNHASAAWNAPSGRYLTAFEANDASTQTATVASDATFSAAALTLPVGNSYYTAVASHPTLDRFLVMGEDGTALLGRYVNAAGTMVAPAFTFTETTGSGLGIGSAANTRTHGVAFGGFDGTNPIVGFAPSLCFADIDAVEPDEDGTTDTFTVQLCRAPGSDVVIDVASDTAAQATVAPAQLTFTTSDWDTPQTLTVTAVNDTDVDGTVDFNIDFTVVDASSSNEYDGVADRVLASALDDDVQGAGGAGGSGGGSMASAGGGTASASSSSANASSGATTGAGGAGATTGAGGSDPVAMDPGEDGDCSCRTPGRSSGSSYGWAGLALLGLGLARRRRSRR